MQFKTRFHIVIGTILIVLIVTSVLLIHNFMQKNDTIIAYVSWTNQQHTVQEAFNNSEVVIAAKVTNGQSNKQGGVVFTDFSIEIIQILKSEEADLKDVLISQTGGKFEGKEYVTDGQIMLNEGDIYLFMLHKRYPNNPESKQYTLIGGYQGALLLDNTGKSESLATMTFSSFNPNNRLENEVNGKEWNEVFSHFIN